MVGLEFSHGDIEGRLGVRVLRVMTVLVGGLVTPDPTTTDCNLPEGEQFTSRRRGIFD